MNMTLKTLITAGCASAIALTGATAAFAQAPAAAPARPPAAPITQGAPIAGLCVFSDQEVLATSAVGRAVVARLQQIGQQANAELQTEQTTLQNDAKTLEGQRGTLDQSALERRAADLQVRDNALQRKAQQRQRELQLTEQQAVGRVMNELEPIVRDAYQKKGCALLINRQALVLPANPTMDITGQVTTALNAKITTLTFDRARLDQPAPAAAAARPAAAPAAPRR
ncbi:OmpH family outer membrane protein [uncultured Phenylobacterium sp.]|uniref:OmpH family outer membrane protein n=1 Tax=uncultured Phenylobacterium sp. TaxID=349273 RepID=UPI00345DF3DD